MGAVVFFIIFHKNETAPQMRFHNDAPRPPICPLRDISVSGEPPRCLVGFAKRSAGELLPRGSYSRLQSKQYQSIDNTIVQLRIPHVFIFHDGDAGPESAWSPQCCVLETAVTEDQWRTRS